MFDTGDINKFGPGKFRTRVDNGEEQTCYLIETNATPILLPFVQKEHKLSQ